MITKRIALFAAACTISACAAQAMIIGEYYNSDPAGQFTTFVQKRLDNNVNFEWGSGKPGIAGIGENNFAVRWKGTIIIPRGGTWNFFTRTDDGAKLYIDGSLRINKWVDQSPTEHKSTVTLSSGPHEIIFEYYEKTGGATAQLSWSSAYQSKQIIPSSAFAPLGYGLTARYDNDADPLTGAARVVRTDAPIFFEWGTGSPDPLINTNNFSARWRGLIEAPGTGTFSFFVTSDDGNELNINGTKIIDDYLVDHSAAERSGTIDLVQGQRYPIDLRFRENGGDAVCKLVWDGPGTGGKVMVPIESLFPTEILQVALADGLHGQTRRLIQYGQTTKMTVVATGAQNPPAYRWMFTPAAGGPRQALTTPGADSPTFELFVESAAQVGTYECEVDDNVDTVMSPPIYVDAAAFVPAASILGLGTLAAALTAAAAWATRRRQ